MGVLVLKPKCDMSIDTALLKQTCEIPGAPGFEKKIRDFVIAQVSRLVDEVNVDNMGNVVAIKSGVDNPEGKRLMVAAHMDERRLNVTHSDDNGISSIHTVEGFDAR